MNLTNDGKNLLLNGDFDPVNITAALFTGPTAGTDEVTGGTYARQSVTYSAASGGVLGSSNTPQFDVSGGTTVTHGGLYQNATLVAFGPITNESFGSDGKYDLTSADITLSDIV